MSKTETFEKLDRIQELRFNKLYYMPYPSRECVERWDKRYKKMCFNVLESFAKERAVNFHSKANDEPEILNDPIINDFYNILYDDIYSNEPDSLT